MMTNKVKPIGSLVREWRRKEKKKKNSLGDLTTEGHPTP
jgi:hypothetical protein